MTPEPVATADAPTAAADRCPNCSAVRPGRYCAECGERRLDPARDHSLRWLLAHLLDSLLQLDGKLLRSFAVLVFAPGRLTRDQLDGRRARYLQPLPLFLTTSVLFYLCFDKAYAAPIETLQANLEQGIWLGNLLRCDLQALLAAKAAATQQEVAVVAARVFERAAQESKLFLGVLIPFLALLLQLLYVRRERRFVPHFVAAVHLFALFLLLDLAFLLVCRLRGMDRITDAEFAPLLVLYAAHVAVALRRIHAERWSLAILRAAAFTAGLTALILVYRQGITIATARWI